MLIADVNEGILIFSHEQVIETIVHISKGMGSFRLGTH